MNSIACLVAVLFILLVAVAQGFTACAFSRRLRSYSSATVPVDSLPDVLIILCLRGGDDGLRDCLEQLGKQNYPHYQIKIVIDHFSDPANQIVETWRSSQPGIPVQVEFLQSPSQSSTLKCSAVRQALRAVDPAVGAVVIVDGDADPHADWLRDLVSPLSLPSVGAVTGNRWYFPAGASWGGWVRMIYNGLALPVMDRLELAWGGSLAVRGEVAFSPIFLQALENASSDESAVWKTLHAKNLRLYFSPRVILINQDAADLTGCFNFISRQLLWTRLYHPAWSAILVYSIVTFLLFAGAFTWGLLSLFTPESMALGQLLLGSLGVYLGVVVASLVLIDQTIRDMTFLNQGLDRPRPPVLRTIARLCIGGPLTLILYSLAILRAWLATRVEWRGVEYKVMSTGGVKLISCHPLVPQVAPLELTHDHRTPGDSP